MKTVPGFESSCKQTLNTPTVKLHEAVLPDISVAVQVTVVAPIAKQEPLGGLQTTLTPGQLSEPVAVKVATVQLEFTLAVTTVWLVGQVTKVIAHYVISITAGSGNRERACLAFDNLRRAGLIRKLDVSRGRLAGLQRGCAPH